MVHRITPGLCTNTHIDNDTHDVACKNFITYNLSSYIPFSFYPVPYPIFFFWSRPIPVPNDRLTETEEKLAQSLVDWDNAHNLDVNWGLMATYFDVSRQHLINTLRTEVDELDISDDIVTGVVDSGRTAPANDDLTTLKSKFKIMNKLLTDKQCSIDQHEREAAQSKADRTSLVERIQKLETEHETFIKELNRKVKAGEDSADARRLTVEALRSQVADQKKKITRHEKDFKTAVEEAVDVARKRWRTNR